MEKKKRGKKNETFEQSRNKTGGWKICGLKLRNIQRGKLFVPTLDTDVSYICLLQFRRRLDKVWETVDELRPYLRSRFIQLKSKSYKATCSERPSETFLKENHVPPLSITSATLRFVLLFLKFFLFRERYRKWYLPRIQFIFRPFKERNSLSFAMNLKITSTMF